MIFTYLFIDNVFNFSEASLDLSLKRKVSYSAIEDEVLINRPNFRYKRVCILSGANASGKTSLGKVMHFVQLFIREPLSNFKKIINDKSRDAIIEAEFVIPNDKIPTIHRLKIIHKVNVEKPIFEYVHIPIGINDSSAIARKKLLAYRDDRTKKNVRNACYLANNETALSKDIDELRMLHEKTVGWYYSFSHNTLSEKVNINSEFLNKNILKSILSTFDTSIEDVTESRDEKELNGYSIKFKNKDSVLIDKNGDTTNTERLSRGTYDAIQVADFVAWIIGTQHSKDSYVFFLDEKMAYSHSEIEQAIVNLIIQKLGRNSQFFYTTHNYDVLDMNLPIHTFTFLVKDGDKASFIQPEKTFKKNDRNLLNYVRNDVFNTIPKTYLIDELLDYEEY